MELKGTIRRLDVFKMIPEEFKESSYLGVGLSILFLITAVILLINQFTLLVIPRIESEMLVDHQKDDKDLVVNLEVLLHSYPCGLVSLDKLDAVHSHTLDVQENMVKYRTNQWGKVIGKQEDTDALTMDARIAAMSHQVENKEGCLLSGNFAIKLVPGNFHISFHKYGPEMQTLMARQGFRPDFSHTIKRLSFGGETVDLESKVMSDFRLETLHSLSNVESTGLMEKLGFPHGVLHQLNIVPSTFDYGDGRVYEVYQYSATSLDISGGAFSITFKFHIENVVMRYKKKSGSFSHFLIQSVAILGGVYMLMYILKMFIEDAVLSSIYKRRIGKLE